MIHFLTMPIYSLSLFATMMVQEFDTRWDENLFSVTKIPPDDILDSLYKLRIRESDQLKTVLELYDTEIHQKISRPDYQKLKTIVKRSTDQKLRLRNFDARNERIETGAVVASRRGLKEFAINGKQKGSVREDTNAVSGTTVMSVQNRHQKPLHPLGPPTQRGRNASRKGALRGRSPPGKSNRQPCKNILQGYLH